MTGCYCLQLNVVVAILNMHILQYIVTTAATNPIEWPFFLKFLNTLYIVKAGLICLTILMQYQHVMG